MIVTVFFYNSTEYHNQTLGLNLSSKELWVCSNDSLEADKIIRKKMKFFGIQIAFIICN